MQSSWSCPYLLPIPKGYKQHILYHINEEENKMDECPNCHKWEMYYASQYEEWKCFHCSHQIPETRENYNKRLLEQNKQGRYSVNPPKR